MNMSIQWLTTAFERLVAFLPSLVAGIVVLLVGWLIAYLLARVTRAVGRRIGFDKLMTKLGITGQDAHAGSRWLGSLVFAIVMVVAVMQASRIWRLDFVANGLAAVIGYLPHAVAAAVVFGIALYIGNWVRDRLFARAVGEESAVTGGLVGPRVLPSLLRGAIIAVGVFMALRELQIAPAIVNAAFILTLGAIAVASALAFGLGGREVAGRMAQEWWERRSSATGSMQPTTTPPPSETPGRVGVTA